MTSEIRVNKLTNRIGLSTVTFADSGIGVTVTGNITSTGTITGEHHGDGSNLTGIAGVSISSQGNNRLITCTGTTDSLTGESSLTYDGTTLQAITSGSGTREQLNLKNQNASAGTSRINFFSTVSGTEFAGAGIRNGVNTVNQGRLYLQTNQGSGLTNALEIYETGRVKVTDGQFEVGGGGITFTSNNKTIQGGSSSYMVGIQGGATYMGGRIELRGGQSGQSGDIRFYAQGATSTQAERARIDSSGIFMVGRTSANLNAQVQIGGRYVDASSTTVDLDTTGTEGPNLKLHTSSNTADHVAALVFDHGSLKSMIAGGRVNTSNWGTDIRFYTHPESTSNVHYTYERMKINSDGHLVPAASNTHDLGASALRWRNVYTTDLQLSNEGKTNDVDGTWGDYTIQEGESDLFLINNRSGKKYKFNLTEVS